MGFPDLAKAQAAVQRVFPIIDRRPAIDSAAPGGQRPGAVSGEVELRDVSFAYVSGRRLPVGIPQPPRQQGQRARWPGQVVMPWHLAGRQQDSLWCGDGMARLSGAGT